MVIRFMAAPGYALVAVTTATEDGVATPSTGAGAGGGVTGGGVLPDGGGVEALEPPPQPPRTTNKMHEDAMNTERMCGDPPELF
jgi:hypothetical protein